MRRFSLLTASCLLLACSGDDAATTGATEDASSSSSSSSSSTTGDTGETSTTTGDTTSGSVSDSASTSTTSGDATTTTTAGETSTTTGGVEFPICEDYCGHIAACFGDVYPECYAECDDLNGIFSGIGPVCGEAMNGVMECAIDLSCEDLGPFLNEMPSPCDEALAKVSDEPPQCALEEEPPAHCAAFCTKADECMVAEPECLLDCTVTTGAGNWMDPACGAAVEAYYTCLAELDCQNLMNPVTCLDEATQLEALCDF
ncbi:MAG: hypothetical protein R3A79_28905 [Nannocystaceae bacterium]